MNGAWLGHLGRICCIHFEPQDFESSKKKSRAPSKDIRPAVRQTFSALRDFVTRGGRLLVLLGEGGERRFQTNINFLLEEYGIVVNSDAVVRTAYHKYPHPKEALISDGILNRAVNRALEETALDSNLSGD
ncbi:hypothetical protein HPB49_018989 [Dermacentor silvarum]|uniref:Uncharacterized protein n=1 Tax=Dermacentor silvarum TaxID=543639 RepID=A0ACB8DQW7_DERSI|nr:hypothetical protein HPB49_018989 [Dermacentor silvarum]